MGTANRDASQITMRNRNKALNAYYQSWKTANVTGNGATNGALTAPAGTSAEVIAQIQAGCAACTVYNNSLLTTNPDPNQVLYPSNLSRGGAQSSTSTS